MSKSTVSNVREGAAAKPESPSAPAAQMAGGIAYVEDSTGRKIGLKKPTPGERFELDDAIATKTQAAALQVSIVGFVISIGEDGLPPLWTHPDPRAEFKKRLNLLGDEGLMLVTQQAFKMMGMTLDEKGLTQAKN